MLPIPKRRAAKRLNVADRAKAIVWHDRAERETDTAATAYNVNKDSLLSSLFWRDYVEAFAKLNAMRTALARHGCLGF